ncbi:uncharacterized protein LOC107019596 [Solanum pennellii]|uniref:Uncharacterized protein LOC107019596 n=1 Tax=Solanum pennellii TaxID=28526 RepID=A0ABM1GSX9_SOLPN|nr:uncharacterized protein LOC107019596 [Solanum pennellii]
MVKDMRSNMSLFVAGLGRASSTEGRATIFIGYMDIYRLMVYVQQVEEEKMKYREEYRNKKEKTGNECGHQKAQSQGSMAQRGSGSSLCGKCGRIYPRKFLDGHTGCFKCGQESHFIRECPNNKQGGENSCNRAQSSSVAPPNKVAPEELLLVPEDAEIASMLSLDARSKRTL